jgi:hydroxypyruvate reductase
MDNIENLKKIIKSGIDRVNPYQMVIENVKVYDNNITIDYENYHITLNLSKFNKIYILGAGKATAKIAKAIEELLGDKITEGIISVKYGHTEELNHIDIIESGHPLPDENSIKAGKNIVELAKKSDDKTLIINLISGGGSALLAYPLVYEDGNIKLTLDDFQNTTQTLLDCGATIKEINSIRKHLSQVKGGRLAKLFYPATSLNFILSDVVGDRLDTIASGLTTHDDTTYQYAMRVINKYGIKEKLPENVVKILEAGLDGKIEETPKENDKCFNKVNNILIGTNYLSLVSCSKLARKLGYNTLMLSSQITGEAKEIARFYAGIAKDVLKNKIPIEKPACIISGGETTVTVTGNGKGGRNQEMALAFLSEIEDEPKSFNGVTFLSSSTDGNDGPTDASGAFASLDVLEKARQHELNINDYMKNNDSYNFFDKINYLFKTGPTNTNVCDIQLIVVT